MYGPRTCGSEVTSLGNKGVNRCRGSSPIRKRPPPYDPPRTLGIGLRQGPRWVCFLISEVPMYAPRTCGSEVTSLGNKGVDRYRGTSPIRNIPPLLGLP